MPATESKFDTGTQYIIELTVKGDPEIRCIADNPCKEKFLTINGGRLRVFHPDSKVIEVDGSVGWDERYECPNCGLRWWTELDG